MRYLLALGDGAGGAQEVHVADERTDTVGETRVVDIRGVDPEAVAEFGVGVRRWWGGDEGSRGWGDGEAVVAADELCAETVMVLVMQSEGIV